MSDTPFEIHDDEINVEEIMQKIRDNIRRRKEAGLLPADPDSIQPSSDHTSSHGPDYSRELSYLSGNWDIQNNSYFISSHRPHIGKYLVKGRNLVHGEVRRYIDPVIWKQTEFNRCAAQTLEGVSGRLSDIDLQVHELQAFPQQIREDLCAQIQRLIKDLRSSVKRKIDEKENVIRDEISDTADQVRSEIQDFVSHLKAEIRDEITAGLIEKEQLIRDELSSSSVHLKNEFDAALIEKEQLIRSDLSSTSDTIRSEMNDLRSNIQAEIADEVRKQVETALLAMDTDIQNKGWLAKVLEGRIASPPSPKSEENTSSVSEGSGINYFVFEDRFRGSRTLIKGRQNEFLPYFEGCRNVLDIGCGRGEFLELMKEQGIGARGVDLDETMVDYCRMRGLEVEQNDALTYLEQLEDASLDGIFIDQVVEHLEPGYLIRLLQLCHQKMKYGFYLVAETVNPLSFTSFANFYIDLTHVRPVHPETLRFLFDNAGFREIDVNFLSPVTDEARLQKVPVSEEIGGVMGETERYRVEVYNRNIEMLNGILYGAQDYVVVGKK